MPLAAGTGRKHPPCSAWSTPNPHTHRDNSEIREEEKNIRHQDLIWWRFNKKITATAAKKKRFQAVTKQNGGMKKIAWRYMETLREDRLALFLLPGMWRESLEYMDRIVWQWPGSFGPAAPWSKKTSRTTTRIKTARKFYLQNKKATILIPAQGTEKEKGVTFTLSESGTQKKEQLSSPLLQCCCCFALPLTNYLRLGGLGCPM